jgi:hypothetical protein
LSALRREEGGKGGDEEWCEREREGETGAKTGSQGEDEREGITM